MKCLQCQSERIVKNISVIERGHNNFRRNLALEVYDDPTALIFKGPHEAKLKANVCCECGFVMLSVSISDAQMLEQIQK